MNDWNPILDSVRREHHASDSQPQPDVAERLDRWPVSYAEMIRDSGEFGTLLFCGLTSERDLLTPPMSGLYTLFDERVKDRTSLRSDIIMLQLWTETQKPLVPEQLEKLQKLFDSFRENVLVQFDRGPSSSEDQNANVTMLTHGETQR